MAEPRIQFVKSGGVSLAYVAIGDGEPLIFLWNPHSNIQQQWAIPEFRSWYEQLSEGRMLILPDYRGTGLSQRDVSDISIEALEEDISALADKLGLETFALFATFTIGPVAISYAAHHPKRVRKLVCWHAYVSGRDYTSPQGKALGSLVANWDLYTDTLARFGLGFSRERPQSGSPQQYGTVLRTKCFSRTTPYSGRLTLQSSSRRCKRPRSFSIGAKSNSSMPTPQPC